MADRPRKRSLTISGHRTSVSIEDDFWEALKDISAEDGKSVTAMIREIDQVRGARSLSSAIRSAVLAHYRNRPVMKSD